MRKKKVKFYCLKKTGLNTGNNANTHTDFMEDNMFKHKAKDGTRNLCGKKIAVLRKNLPEKTSQRLLAEKMQIKGIDMDKTAIKRIENGERYVTDIELKALSEIFSVSTDFLIDQNSVR